ncbi:MAG: hypothetical protein OSB09_11830 [Planctomycetota bacterium]|nr:hypothetical protein [Planctomycetota bacterium]
MNRNYDPRAMSGWWIFFCCWGGACPGRFSRRLEPKVAHSDFTDFYG